ncbi:MAG: ferrous iron transport protein B [Candidatus Methanogranum gryphiswaldense]|nr:MAG: ferrous iron transport protein B [Candidatus Methanogranum sp. U3.2.1]
MVSDIVQVALIGQPNVGKSALFARMTGVGVISSNYSGTTVEFEEAHITRNGVTVNVHDLPGIYSLSKNSLDEDAAIKMLADPDNDAIIIVADATNLESSIVLCFEVLELGLPSILALNKIDAAKNKYDIDTVALSKSLGITVIPVSARTSEGVDALVDAVCAGKASAPNFRVNYSKNIEVAASSLAEVIPEGKYRSFGVAIKLIEGTKDFIDMVPEEVNDNAEKFRRMLNKFNNESPEQTIGRERYALADIMVKGVMRRTQRTQTTKEKFSDMTITPLTGIPIMLAVLGMIFLTIVYVGSFLDSIISSFYDWCIGNWLTSFASGLDPFWKAVVEGINGSVGAILSLVIPYIMVFYIILGILEDSGYLTRVVVLLDTTMHRFGLHGGAAIPVMVGIGCNVPAILATRTIQSRRERLIITSIIVMAVPCSAQMAIIMGITGKYAGIPYALAILVMLVALGCLIGLILNKYLTKEPSSLAMELPDLVMPQARNVLFKTWERIKDFFVIAFPLLVIGSIIVEILLTYDLLNWIIDPLSFITVGMLGLPAVCVIAFIVGILRKEMAVGMLVMLGLLTTMTPEQFVVFGVVMATYVPCIATLTVMWRELGWKDTFVVSIISCFVAILLGTMVNILFIMF